MIPFQCEAWILLLFQITHFGSSFTSFFVFCIHVCSCWDMFPKTMRGQWKKKCPILSTFSQYLQIFEYFFFIVFITEFVGKILCNIFYINSLSLLSLVVLYDGMTRCGLISTLHWPCYYMLVIFYIFVSYYQSYIFIWQI